MASEGARSASENDNGLNQRKRILLVNPKNEKASVMWQQAFSALVLLHCRSISTVGLLAQQPGNSNTSLSIHFDHTWDSLAKLKSALTLRSSQAFELLYNAIFT